MVYVSHVDGLERSRWARPESDSIRCANKLRAEKAKNALTTLGLIDDGFVTLGVELGWHRNPTIDTCICLMDFGKGRFTTWCREHNYVWYIYSSFWEGSSQYSAPDARDRFDPFLGLPGEDETRRHHLPSPRTGVCVFGLSATRCHYFLGVEFRCKETRALFDGSGS